MPGGETGDVHDDYILSPDAPTVEEYLRLRAESGLTPRTRAQAEAAIPGSWATCTVRHRESGEAVADRVIGDGGWYFHVVDMAVLPAYQRRGLGDAVLSALRQRIEDAAPPGAYVTLMADAPGRRLYERHGFVDTAPRSVGMALAPATPDSC